MVYRIASGDKKQRIVMVGTVWSFSNFSGNILLIDLFSGYAGSVNAKISDYNGESVVSSPITMTYTVRALLLHRIAPEFIFAGGLSLETLSVRIRHEATSAISEFEDLALLVGVPIGIHAHLFGFDHLYFPIYLVSNFKILSDVSVALCTGFCRPGTSMDAFLPVAEFDAAWAQGRWHFQLLGSQGLKKQYDTDRIDIRLAGVQFGVGYRF